MTDNDRGAPVSGGDHNQGEGRTLQHHHPQVWCPNREAHEPHWHTIRAGGITYAGGWCRGEARGEVSS